LTEAAKVHLGLERVDHQIVDEHPALVARVAALDAELSTERAQLLAERDTYALLAEEKAVAERRAQAAEELADAAHVADLEAQLADRDSQLAALRDALVAEQAARAGAEERASEADKVIQAFTSYRSAPARTARRGATVGSGGAR
jgi:hypothetical protein